MLKLNRVTPNSTTFENPTRQSIFAVIIIIQKFVFQTVRQLWPILIVFFIGSSGKKSDSLLFYILVFTAFSSLWAILSYYKYSFFIKGDELIIKKGVLQKISLNIPFDRIQSINFQQSLLHRILNIVKVEIDTAGSSKNELALDALSLGKANDLRDIILSQKSALSPLSVDQSSEVIIEEKLVLKIDIPKLLKISFTQNHLRSGWLIFAFGIWMISQLDEVGVDTENMLQSWLSNFSTSNNTIYILLFILLVFISLLVSIARIIIKYYDLSLWRSGNKYRLVHGLFTKKEVAILDKKIQVLAWKNNPLKKAFGLFDIYIKQASGNTVSLNKSIQIPGCDNDHVQYFHKNWLDNELLDLNDAKRVSIFYWYRRMLFSLLFSFLVIGVLYFINAKWWLLSLLLIPYFVLTTWLAYKKRSYLLTDEFMYIGQGVFGDHFSVMPLYKIQSVIIKQNRFEHRRNLATLDVSTASGKLQIPYIQLSNAQTICDYVLMKAEISRKSWM